jgi:hypothetical protein
VGFGIAGAGPSSYVTNMQDETERWRTNIGHEFHITKQEKMSVSTRVQKHLFYEL